MEKSRPKIKLKSTAKIKATESVQSDRSQDPLTGASEGPVASVGHGDGLFPLVNEGVKRKRAPRVGERRTKQKHLLTFTMGSDAPSVQTEEGGFSGEEDEDREEVKEESRLRDGRQFMTGSRSEMLEIEDVKSTQPVQQRQGRLKVKVKASKLQEESPAHPGNLKGNDNDISSSLLADGALEIQNTAAGVLRELQKSVAPKSEMQANKPGRSIEKSSNSMTEAARPLDRPSTPRRIKSNRPDEMANTSHQIQTEKSLWSSENQETKDFGVERGQHDRSQYNEKELSDALMVVKKIMKMEAAEPFNTPVNPVALGIPDYFDVIDNPMDLGTICSTLERGEKYMNSRDVFKDVQFIWENCCKYNSKGDPILDLMKRVKKNFAKYWTAAGLYYEPQKRTTGTQLAGQGDVVSNREYGRLEESEMEHEGHNNADGNLDDSQMATFAGPCTRSPQLKDKPGEQAENKTKEQNMYHENIEASKAQHYVKESEADVDIAQACEKDAVVENNARKLMNKKSKDKYEPQDKAVISDEKVDCVSVGTDEESGPKAADSTRSFHDETEPKDTQSKIKTRRRHGKYHHKDGCLCAVCMARRRRHERETNARLAKNQSMIADVDLPGTAKKQASEFEKPFTDNGGTKLDHSVEMDVISQPDEQGDESKVELQEQEEGEIQEQEEEETHKQKGRFTNRMHQQEENELPVQEEEEAQLQEKKESQMHEEEEAQQQGDKALLTQHKDEEQQKQLKELQMQQEYEGQHQEVKEGHGQEEEESRHQEGEIQEEGESGRYCPADYEIPLQFASPSIMQMCEVLFASNHYSAWNRAHSLSYKPSVTFSENPILAAISAFME